MAGALQLYQPHTPWDYAKKYATYKAGEYTNKAIDYAASKGGQLIKRGAQAVMRKGKQAVARVRNSFRRSGGRKAITGRITTEQRDSRVGYVKHRMPRRRRRRWTSFTRKVQHVMLQMGALQTISNTYGTVRSWLADKQAYWGYMIGGVAPTENDDLLRAFRAAYGSALALSDLDDYKLFIKSLCLDLQINNNGSTTAIIEIYHLQCRKSYNTTTALDVQYSDTFAEVPAQTGYTRAIDDLGYTPFQNPIFCSHWSIVKKEQVQLGPGELSTMQIRIPTNKMFYGKTLETNPSCIKGYTRGLLFVMKGEPENNAGSYRQSAGEIIFGTQTSVNYQLPPSSTRAQTANS